MGFLVTFILTPFLARRLKEKGIVGVDLHKYDKPKVPEMVGVSILFGFLLSSGFAYFALRDTRLLVIIAVTFLTGILGLIDGFKKLTALQKVIFLSAIGVLLVPFSNPIISGYNLGLLYLLSVPFCFMCASNFTNMLAGFNGLEIGTGAIASAGLAIISLINGSELSFLTATALLGPLLAFLYFNRFPAKVFPGDVGTLIIGAVIFSSAILGKLEFASVIIFLPYIIDAGLKYFSVGVMTRESQTPTVVKEGKLYIPEGSNLSLSRLFLKRRPMTEEEVVMRVWAVEVISCAIAVFLVVVT